MASGALQLIFDHCIVRLQLWVLQLQALWTWQDDLSSWCLFQFEVWRLLELEKARRLEMKRLARTGQTELKAELPHVDTSIKERMKSKAKDAEDQPIIKDLVLIGGGHSHAYTIKNFGMNPVPGVRVTLITREMDTPYSGMVPGYIAGFYTREECHIDLVRLARFGNARVIHAEATAFDLENRLVHVSDGRPPVSFDVLSIDIGITPSMEALKEGTGDGSVPITPVKPIDGFSARWAKILERACEAKSQLSIVVVGGGAGGTELTLSIHARLRSELESRGRDPDLVSVTLISKSKTIMPSHNVKVQKAFRKILKDRGINVLHGAAAVGAKNGCIVTVDGQTVPADECVWCTAAGAAGWLRDTGLQLDPKGFIACDDTLQSLSHPFVFAAGDCASVLKHPRPKAGVFAVRQGPPLTQNLRNMLLDQPMEPFEPQSVFLGLIGTGDSSLCVASKGEMCLQGSWLWDLKDWIDRKWMLGYGSGLPEMEESSNIPLVARNSGPEILAALSHAAMRCGGCGAKVGATVLSRVLKQLDVPTRPEVLAGLDAPDDCAIIASPGHEFCLVQTVDFFRSFWSDPYVFGQIAANHALSDIHAMCGEAVSALAIAVVPFAVDDKIESSLLQMMAGACAVLKKSNCALVGGHSCEGKELSLGFAVNGNVATQQVLRKSGMTPGDVLILTKPVGTGVIFAAEMRRKVGGAHVAAALDSMILSNKEAAFILRDHGATACTDVTGFGLLGHLVEMAKPSDVLVELDLEAVPLLPGAMECVQRGVFSSLQDSNLRLKHAIVNEKEAVQHHKYPLIFDPQTAGGLLATVPEDMAQQTIDCLSRAGYRGSTIIGKVKSRSDEERKMNYCVECRT